MPNLSAKKTIIVIGTDSPIGLSIIRELGRHGLYVHGIGTTVDSIGRRSKYCSTFSLRPSQQPIRNWIHEEINKVYADAVLAYSEDDLIELSELPSQIGNCKILTPRTGPLRKVLDKQLTLSLAEGLGITIPKTFKPTKTTNAADILNAIQRFPLVAKWADTSNIIPLLKKHGIKFHKTEFILNEEELLTHLEKYAVLGQYPILQEYAIGVGIGQMLHMQNGRPTLFFQHRRVNEWPPEGGVSTICKSIDVTEHTEQAKKSTELLRALNWEGVAMVEYRYNFRTDQFTLMEVNGRFWGGLPLATQANAHFAWEIVRLNLNLPQTPMAPISSNLSARYIIPDARRLLRLIFQSHLVKDPNFKFSIGTEAFNFFISFINPSMRYYVLDVRDPLPWAQDMLNVAVKITKRLHSDVFRALRSRHV
jgi:predicted ATP-grasp superfamily ATP-dependent carboligase